MSPMPQKRFPLRERAHARQVARKLPLGDLFTSIGTVEGFADWLFVNRSTFNGSNPLQQARVYINRCRQASKRGGHLDTELRASSEQKERARAQARAKFDTAVSMVRAWWLNTPVGADITLAATELCLGNGGHFAALDGSRPCESHPSWLLDRLVADLETLGGPDDALDRCDWMQEFSEGNFRRKVEAHGEKLVVIRKKSAIGDEPTGVEVVTVAHCMLLMSKVMRTRVWLRAQTRQAKMVERIVATAQSFLEPGPQALRSRRIV